ncbi:50S ribosomal protein L23 [Candidatus Omnitrophota bacterium]
MKSNYEIIKTPLITEKLQSQQDKGIYGFWVDKNANKIEIRKAIEKIYSVSVERVSVLTVPGKKRRLRFKEGHQPSWKKAVVRIKAGQTITIG